MRRGARLCGGCGLGEEHSVIDYVQSHRVCTGCGVVCRGLIPPQDDGFHASERSCIAAASVGSVNARSESERTVARSQQRTQTPLQRQTVKMIGVVEDLAERLGLSPRLREETHRVVLAVRRAHKRKVKKDELMAAACICIACRRLQFPKSFRDVAVACAAVTTTELGRTFKVLSRAIGGNNSNTRLRAMVPRFATMIGFRGRDVMLCEAVACAAHREGVVPGRNPLSIIAGTLHLVATMRGVGSASGAATRVGVAETTTRKACRALLRSVDAILPPETRRQFGLSDSAVAAAVRLNGA